MNTFRCIVSSLLVVCTLCTPFYNDQKQNCTLKHVTGSYCYGGPRFDDVGQYKSCSVPNTMALTFDDGLDTNVPYFLDMLKLFKMKATFFVIGQNIAPYASLLQRMVDEGHQVGAHTYSHPWLKDLTYNQTVQDMYNFENAFLQQHYTGVLANRMVPSYFRAPHGDLPLTTVPILNKFKMIPIQWSFLTQDTTVTDPSLIPLIWKSHLTNADSSQLTLIVQQHDVKSVTKSTLYEILTYLNTTFPDVNYVTVAECLNNVIPPYHVSDSIQVDPLCMTGIKAIQSGKTVCCSLSCGTCGGTGCSTRTGGASSCCTGDILTANKSCSISSPPCVVTAYQQSDPTCLTGIKTVQSGKTVCCLSSCGTCGGTGCSTRTGGASGCCAGDILVANKTCTLNRPPCVVSA